MLYQRIFLLLACQAAEGRKGGVGILRTWIIGSGGSQYLIDLGRGVRESGSQFLLSTPLISLLDAFSNNAQIDELN